MGNFGLYVIIFSLDSAGAEVNLSGEDLTQVEKRIAILVMACLVAAVFLKSG